MVSGSVSGSTCCSRTFQHVHHRIADLSPSHELNIKRGAINILFQVKNEFTLSFCETFLMAAGAMFNLSPEKHIFPFLYAQTKIAPLKWSCDHLFFVCLFCLMHNFTALVRRSLKVHASIPVSFWSLVHRSLCIDFRLDENVVGIWMTVNYWSRCLTLSSSTSLTFHLRLLLRESVVFNV